MSWLFDAPSGTYKNHALSSNIRREAIADVQTMKFITNEPGYGKGKGESLTITRILKLPLATTVSETERLPSGRPAIQTKTVSVSEWGFKIETTEFERDLTHFDMMNQFQMNLRDQMSLTMDKMGADAFKLTPIKYIPTTSGYTFDTDGTPSSTATRNVEVSDLRAIHDYLSSDLKAPKYRNGQYIGILSTKAARGIKNDPEYKDWLAPTSNAQLVSGALKNIEGFDLYESNNSDSFEALAGNSTTTGEAIFFGADSVRLLSVVDPEIRRGLPEDLGRFSTVGWYGIIQAFLVWEQAANARVVHVTSN